ncbi:hypothetical protein Glove_135g72 [Diversispora epigaea]|uniref:Uncharacterized protein n=1 Tax=Diversispora epigaea TaxID=1348612 RepID=A0A397J5X5_9GLOM|nr:hypothetical protein Glove_135g72 [Diversispora epigaea]
MCTVANKALIDALGWGLGNAPNISLTHNSDHITKLIGGHRDVPISVKYIDEQGVEHLITVTGNIVFIDDGKTDYLLCIGAPWIRKVKGIPDLNKHEFRMTVHSKSYVIPTFTKPIGDISEDQPSRKISSRCTTDTAQDNTQDTETSEEWLAPEGFKLPDSVTEEDTAQDNTQDTETSEEWLAPEGFKLPDSVTEEVKKNA